jgi:hypothetical protein
MLTGQGTSVRFWPRPLGGTDGLIRKYYSKFTHGVLVSLLRMRPRGWRDVVKKTRGRILEDFDSLNPKIKL